MSHFITYLALERFASVTATEAVAAFGTLAGSFPMQVTSAGPAKGAPGEAFILSVGGATVTVMFVDKPLPEDAWRRAAALSIPWPDAAAAMRRTRAHVIVALLENTADHAHALNGAAAVTMVAGALSTRLPVAATVFAESEAIVTADEIKRSARNLASGKLPDTLWMTTAFGRGPVLADGRQTTEARTSGLAAFVGREIEFEPVALKPFDVASRLVGLCNYLIASGPVIKDGETVGLTETEKIRVRYKRSGKYGSGPVMLLTLETEDMSNADVFGGRA